MKVVIYSTRFHTEKMVLNSVSAVNLILEINGKSKLFCQLKRHLSPKTVGLISRALPMQCNAHKWEILLFIFKQQ